MTMLDFKDAKDKVLMGREKIDGNDSKEKELTAYHEAGHALVMFTPGNDPFPGL